LKKFLRSRRRRIKGIITKGKAKYSISDNQAKIGKPRGRIVIVLNHQPNFLFLKRRLLLFKNNIPIIIDIGPNIIKAKRSTRPPINSGLDGGKNNLMKNTNVSIPINLIHQAAIFVFLGRDDF
jgi:hypothetical protein